MAFFINFKEINKLKVFSKNVHTIKRPIFVKDFFKTTQELADLEYTLNGLEDNDKKDEINELILNIKDGLRKDNNVYFEIKNSFIPALCIYDLNLEYEGEKLHMDYVLICNRYICVLETKKLSGDMYFNKKGELIRKTDELVIPSPIQNVKEKTFKLKKVLAEELDVKFIPYHYISLLCNDDDKIDKTNCPKSIKDSIFVFNEVIGYLEKQFEKENYDLSEEDMYKVANLLLKINKTEEYSNKYLNSLLYC